MLAALPPVVQGGRRVGKHAAIGRGCRLQPSDVVQQNGTHELDPGRLLAVPVSGPIEVAYRGGALPQLHDDRRPCDEHLGEPVGHAGAAGQLDRLTEHPQRPGVLPLRAGEPRHGTQRDDKRLVVGAAPGLRHEVNRQGAVATGVTCNAVVGLLRAYHERTGRLFQGDAGHRDHFARIPARRGGDTRW